MISLELSKPAIFLAIALIGLAITGIIIGMLPVGDLPDEAISTISWISQTLTNFGSF